MPRAAAAVLRHRLNPAAFQRAVTLAQDFDVEAALRAGFFDELVEPADLLARAATCAQEFGKLEQRAHAASKRAIRAAVMRKIRRSIPLDLFDAILIGMRRK